MRLSGVPTQQCWQHGQFLAVQCAVGAFCPLQLLQVLRVQCKLARFYLQHCLKWIARPELIVSY